MSAVTPVVPVRAALYLRVSTRAPSRARCLHSPDQRRQGEAYCTARLSVRRAVRRAGRVGDQRSAARVPADDGGGTVKPPAFDTVVVHAFSRFFRDHFDLEFCVRKLAEALGTARCRRSATASSMPRSAGPRSGRSWRSTRCTPTPCGSRSAPLSRARRSGHRRRGAAAARARHLGPGAGTAALA